MKANLKLQEQNKRYRRALQFYANENNRIVFEGTKETTPGAVARQALDGDKH